MLYKESLMLSLNHKLTCYQLNNILVIVPGLLYTRFVKIQHTENDQQTLTGNVAVPGSMNSYGCLRPTLDMGLGLGWGMYFYDRTYHIDFAAKYDFMLLWDQNVMRKLVSQLETNNIGYTDPTGDLYLHGLTVKARFDF